MGQKVHPTGIRLGIIKKHTSVWYANSATYADKLLADISARTFIQKKLASASVSRVDIERPSQSARVTIHSARPGIVIGKKGEDVEKLRGEIAKILGVPVHINIEEIRKPDIDAVRDYLVQTFLSANQLLTVVAGPDQEDKKIF